MESRYKERATKLVNSHILQLLAPNADLGGGIIQLMCRLAEEVEQIYKDPLVFGEEGVIQKVYSKAYVEELLRKQRELCAEKAEITDISRFQFKIDKDSILNAKLKID